MKGETKATETDHMDEQSTEDEEKVEVSEPEIIDEQEEPSEESEELKQVKEELKKVIEEKDKYYNHMLHLQAEYDNFKKRTQKASIAERKDKPQDLATELLPVLDTFEPALQ